ncbi:MAG: adenylate/guanylate cyclase domain-containing protein [Pseudomonadota bacterium]
MLCPKCSSPNREGRRFCAKCGATLQIACPACGFVNEPTDEFCGGCGAVLAQSATAKVQAPETVSPPVTAPPAAEGERRQVTILFADLSGFTKLSSQQGAEETHRLLSRFFETVDGIVVAYGGTIDKHVGDAVMALFGAPEAHGNDPERAVRAAAEAHKALEALSGELNLPLKAHIGIASGQVVASGLGSERHREYTVLGDSVNLAARLVELAPAGETLVSDPVYRAVSGLVDADEVAGQHIKGWDRTVKVWRLKALRKEAQARRTRFVGRRTELRQFRGILDAYRETGAGQAVYVRGEAGIGKSRLVEEFAALAAEQGFLCHTGLVLDFGVGRGRDAIRGVVRGLLDLPYGTNKKVRARTAEQAVAVGLIERDRLVFLRDLLDVSQDKEMRAIYDAMDNDTRNRGKEDCVATLLARLSERRPLMIAIEDVHWADPLTRGHLARMTQAAAECRVLVVMTSRLEGEPLDRAWRQAAGRTALTTVDLAPLREDEALALAGDFVDATDRFARNCIRRAEGNPMFLEQLLRGAEAAEEEDVPGSIQSIVLSRVDRLSPADKLALQAAAVLGQRFALEVLRVLIDGKTYECDGLVEHYLVRPIGGEYLFAHALIWESVYGSLLRARRQALHRRAAEWFATRDPALWAEHLDRAGDPAAAGAYREAARAQMETFQYERALQLAARGLELGREGADRYGLLMLRGECLREMGRPADSIAVTREALAAAATDAERCRAWIGLAAGMRVTDAYDEALGMLDRAEAAAKAERLDRELSQVHYYRGNLYFPLGNIEGCLEQHRLALEYAERAGSPEDQARALSGLGDAYYARGRMITSLDYFRRCIALCREFGYGRIEVGSQYMVAWNRLYMNEVEGALADCLEAIRSAERVGHQRAEMLARLAAIRILVEKDDVEAAKPHCERGLELAASLGASRFKPFLLIYLARIELMRSGHRPETTAMMEEALEVSRKTGIGFVGAWVCGTLALVSDDPAKAAAALAEGEKILAAGCVGHNYFAFYRDAMEVALRNGAFDEVVRYAAALIEYSRPEPLPWAEFVAARGKALAAHVRGTRDEKTRASLLALKAEAERVGLLAAVPALDRALGI